MATKGASNRYPNGKRSSNGKSISHINFEWARDFNKNSLDIHFHDHGKNMGFVNKESYRQHAINFSNNIDKRSVSHLLILRLVQLINITKSQTN